MLMSRVLELQVALKEAMVKKFGAEFNEFPLDNIRVFANMIARKGNLVEAVAIAGGDDNVVDAKVSILDNGQYAVYIRVAMVGGLIYQSDTICGTLPQTAIPIPVLVPAK
ncbi:MAG: hypothetical protein WC802_05270 [Patescibacteria group bacterium]|jgi:hypothetical protein